MKIKDILARYTARTEKIKSKPGYWNTLKVSIYEDDKQIGEYDRNYPTLYNTFVPFWYEGNVYALYSKDYTATRIMSLPDCKDLGGEERYGFGFCPTGYYVPYINDGDFDDREYFRDRLKEYENYGPNGEFGFVCGCVWGDDSSWKIQYLDLKGAAEGKIVRDDRFGYLELLGKSENLSKAIYVDEYDYEEYNDNNIRIEISGTQTFSMNGSRNWDSIKKFQCPKCNRKNSLRIISPNSNYPQTLFIEWQNDRVRCPNCGYEEKIK